MASDAQVEANRTNAARSTGPRTAEGKARSSRNAIKHGLLVKEVCLADEDEELFANYWEKVLIDLDPHTMLECLLAEAVAAAGWRYKRLLRIEREVFEEELAREARARIEEESAKEAGEQKKKRTSTNCTNDTKQTEQQQAGEAGTVPAFARRPGDAAPKADGCATDDRGDDGVNENRDCPPLADDAGGAADRPARKPLPPAYASGGTVRPERGEGAPVAMDVSLGRAVMATMREGSTHEKLRRYGMQIHRELFVCLRQLRWQQGMRESRWSPNRPTVYCSQALGWGWRCPEEPNCLAKKKKPHLNCTPKIDPMDWERHAAPDAGPAWVKQAGRWPYWDREKQWWIPPGRREEDDESTNPTNDTKQTEQQQQESTDCTNGTKQRDEQQPAEAAPSAEYETNPILTEGYAEWDVSDDDAAAEGTLCNQTAPPDAAAAGPDPAPPPPDDGE